MLKAAIKKIQDKANECINNDLTAMKNSLFLKLQYLNHEQRKTFLEQELFLVAENLVKLRNIRIINSLLNYTADLNFLWESTLIECLSLGEKKKYNNFDLSTFELNQYVANNHCYDDSLPYFSQIVQFIVLSLYIEVLKNELESYQIPIPTNEKKISSVDEKSSIKKTFESDFDIKQIEILTCCINKARIFTEFVFTETVSQIFNCNLSKPLRVKNNRRLAYFFVSLDDRSLITHHWQSVCEVNQLFLSSIKGKVLKQTDLSTATNECRDFPPKDSAIIDKYIKELKKH